MWASIAFTSYAALYIFVVLQQLNIDRNYLYNTALKNFVTDQASEEEGVTIEDILKYEDLTEWLSTGFKGLASEIQQDNGFTGYYIQEVNYILGSKFRLCF